MKKILLLFLIAVVYTLVYWYGSLDSTYLICLIGCAFCAYLGALGKPEMGILSLFLCCVFGIIVATAWQFSFIESILFIMLLECGTLVHWFIYKIILDPRSMLEH